MNTQKGSFGRFVVNIAALVAVVALWAFMWPNIQAAQTAGALLLAVVSLLVLVSMHLLWRSVDRHSDLKVLARLDSALALFFDMQRPVENQRTPSDPIDWREFNQTKRWYVTAHGVDAILAGARKHQLPDAHKVDVLTPDKTRKQLTARLDTALSYC